MGEAAQKAAAKGCKKKRVKKDLMTAQMQTGKRKKENVATANRRRDKHDQHLMDWAARNGVVAGCPASARTQVKEHRRRKHK